MKFSVRDMGMTALMTALLCILGPLSLPIGPVPVSLTTFAVILSVYILGPKKGTLSVIIYLLIGLAGLPVFSGAQGGLLKLAGPTGGYLIGFIPLAFISGMIIEKMKDKKILCTTLVILSNWILYMCGTIWLTYSAHMTFGAAFAAGVAPFVITDIIKVICAELLGNRIRFILNRQGITGPA